MNIKPQGTKLIVTVLPRVEEKGEGGIIIPGTANADLREGEVVAVGAQLESFISPGDIILFPEKRGCEQRINGKDYLWLDAEQGYNEVWGLIQKQPLK